MVKWIELTNFMCPACPFGGGSDWICNMDRLPVYLNEEGSMKCQFGSHTGPLINWTWNCGSDYHKGEFLTADFEGFTFAMSQAVQLTSRAGAEWVAALLHNIGKQYGK
ncbi:uncharacterized protein LOC132740639 [Ruditapes philippinarum]|uniref:uncharacterized protein LOC132740639 n=1 Tax=Ruditapes philippinarum TaxID=129788 RepID=UPI00295B01CB|nr:uncharacterized protein LOC132740639 [Ruditapes philippinarum]